MPELPDVELFRRRLRDKAFGRRIVRADVRAPRLLEGVSRTKLKTTLARNEFLSSRRHGKHLFLKLKRDGWLTLHFGMSGALEPFRAPREEPKHTRMLIGFADGSRLAYTSIRMLGRIGLADTPQQFIADRGLGPDALDRRFDSKAFERVCSPCASRSGSKRPIKSVLMDQSLIAGIGNIFSDEILFAARVHPLARCDELNAAQIRKIHHCMRTTLETAIRCGAGTEAAAKLPHDYLLPERFRGGHCPRCGSPLATFKLSGRTGYYCSRCQVRG